MLSKEEYIKRKKDEWINKKVKKYCEQKNINHYYKSKSKDELLVSKYYDKRKDDIINQIIDNLTKRLIMFLKKHNVKRELTHMQILGCDKEKLRNHLSVQFVENMSFDNYGKWEIDHIIPINSCNPKDLDSIKKIFNYKNLQPLWKPDNIKKSDKII